MKKSAEGKRITVEIISLPVSSKVWDRARIELARNASVGRHITDCATRPGQQFEGKICFHHVI